MDSQGGVGPLGVEERFVLMDGLRGLALFGILLVNLRGMGGPSMAYGEFSLWTDPLSKAADQLSAFFLNGAFWSLFALLFGAGFSVMLGSTGARTRSIGLAAYYRRLFLIGGFGLLHVILLWWGDILMIYALAGMALPLFRKCRVRVLLTWAAFLLAAPVGVLLLTYIAGELVSAKELAEWSAEYAEETRGWTDFLVEWYLSPSFSAVVWVRGKEFIYNLWYVPPFLPSALGMMLMGMAFAKQERFCLDAAQDAFFRKLLVWSIAPAVLGKLGYVYGVWWNEDFDFWGNAAFLVGSAVGGLASAMVMICAMRAFYRSQAWGRHQRGLAAAGRMALTLYLMQSLIAGFLFYGYGLGLYASVPPHGLIVLGVLIFTGQVAFAQLWFKHHRQGPLEYVLRKFTYLR